MGTNGGFKQREGVLSVWGGKSRDGERRFVKHQRDGVAERAGVLVAEEYTASTSTQGDVGFRIVAESKAANNLTGVWGSYLKPAHHEQQ